MSELDPYEIGTGEQRAFWADAVADSIEEREPTEPIVVKGGVSPSGVPHIGHFNEIMRGYFVAEALRDRGYEVTQVFTSDDKDRLRKMPRRLADLDWNVVELGDIDAGVLGQNLGKPYSEIPDPFECCDSYGAHFTELLARSAAMVGVPIKIVSNTKMYAAGKFDAAISTVLSQQDTARDLLSEFQEKIDDGYVPFFPQCANCGLLTETVTEVNLEDQTIAYECASVDTGDIQLDGCGYRGTASFKEGKLPWRFEWPAQWDLLDVDFEPFGKDHAEGSWPSGQRIAQDIFGIEPPVPMVYEWFTLDGSALSSSSGNIITVHEVLELLEVEVFRYFFTKNPKKQRDFDIGTLDRLTDEFDHMERIYYDIEDESTISPIDTRRAKRVYPMVTDPTVNKPERIPYRFAAVLGMTADRDLQIQMAQRSGHLSPDAADETIDTALARIQYARTWAEETDNEFNYRLAEECPPVSIPSDMASALDELASSIKASDPTGDELQSEIYEVARKHDIPVGDFFETGYQLFLNEPDGPRLGPFLAALDTAFVVERLRRDA